MVLPAVVTPEVSRSLLCSRQREARTAKSRIRYVRVMGLKEEAVQGIGFKSLAIFRPGIIAGNAHTPSYAASLGRLIPGPVLLSHTGPWLSLTVPIEAIITAPMANHCVAVSRSLRNTSPANAAIAGSRLIKVPNVFVASFRNAIISSV